MDVAILQPHDCLKRHNQYNHHNRRPLLTKPKPNPNTNPNRSNRRRRNSPPPPQHQQTRPRSPPVSGPFRILKRGEDISLSLPPITTAKVSEPEKVKSRSFSGPISVDGFYAGSAFVTSPPPSEVPLPAFFTKRGCGGESHNDEIACELRKVLKLQV